MNYATTWPETFMFSLQNLWFSVVDVLPKIILAVLLFIVGWIIAGLVKQGIREIIRTLKIDHLLSQVGVDLGLEKAGFRLDSGLFVGELFKWFLVVLFLQMSLNLVGLTAVNDVLGSIVAFLPKVVVAVIILIAGSLITKAIVKLVEGSARLTSGHSHMASVITRWSMWIFTIYLAIGTLGIFNAILLPLLYGVVGMLALAGGLAFGLGGRDAASKAIDGWTRKG
jgi:Conserved TM helix